MMVGNAIFAIISLAIVAIVITEVFIPTIQNANTSSWSSGELALWGVVTLVAIAGFVYNVAAAFGLA
jgi:TRAP-type mannitol/chloroaromatic compound transport system permease small subunit